MATAIIGWIIILCIFFVPWLITLIKKKRQLGKTWSGHVSATVTIADKPLICPHCQNNKFFKREGILVTSWVAFSRLIFWNGSAACFVCTHCGNIQWFVRSPKETATFEIKKE